MSFGGRALSAFGKVGIVLSIIILFLFGFMGTVYLSLRTSEVKVPDVLGKDRYTAETLLNGVGLNIRVKSTRPSAEKPDTILSQLPEAGQIVKAGIPVAVEVSRAPKEGESVPSSTEETKPQEESKPADNANANQATTNQNQNQNKPKNKNANKNSNNANSKNSNNSNKNSNANNANAIRNANSANANRTTGNSNNRNATTSPNTNRSNTNANKRAPATTTPSPRPGANRNTR